MTVGERIAARRKELNMTQGDLARKLGYKSRSSVNKIELSLSKVPLSKLERIADALDCEAAYLMGWQDAEPVKKLAYRTAVQQQLLEGFDRLTDINKGRVLQYVETRLENQEKKTDSSLSSAG